MPPEPSYTPRQAADLLGHHPETIRELCRAGDLKAERGNGPNGRWHIPASAITDYRNRRTYNPAAA